MCPERAPGRNPTRPPSQPPLSPPLEKKRGTRKQEISIKYPSIPYRVATSMSREKNYDSQKGRGGGLENRCRSPPLHGKRCLRRGVGTQVVAGNPPRRTCRAGRVATTCRAGFKGTPRLLRLPTASLSKGKGLARAPGRPTQRLKVRQE